MTEQDITKLFPTHIRKALGQALFDRNKIYEIRLRCKCTPDCDISGERIFSEL